MTTKLLLGVAQTDITPQIGARLFGYAGNIASESVHDRLSATAFYFEEGQTKALMVSITVAVISTALSDKIRAEISDALSIPFENCMLCATHTHTGPTTAGQAGWGNADEAYCETIFIPQILKAAKEAASVPVPVTMGIAQGKSYIGMNRRQHTLKNRIELGQNPWGIFCPDMTVVSFRDMENNTVANMVHYGIHGTSAGKVTAISRDFSGIMIDRLTAETGGITAFFNGPEGDVGPRIPNGKTIGTIEIMEELGGVAARDAYRIYKEIRTFDAVSLSVTNSVLEMPLDKRISREDAQIGYDRFCKNTNSTGMGWANHYKTLLDSYENGYADKEIKEIPQTIIKIGPLAFVGFPYELFSAIGMRIAEASPVPYTLSLSCTNGSEGYFVTDDALRRAPYDGGYEVTMYTLQNMQPYAKDADFYLITETLKNMEDLSCTE